MSEPPGEHEAIDPSALEASALVAGTLGMNALRVEALEADTIARAREASDTRGATTVGGDLPAAERQTRSAQGSDPATAVQPLSRIAQLRQMAAGTGLLGRFVYMAMTQGVTLLLGIAYWTTTTRTFPTHDVGYAAAIVAAAAFVNAIGALGIGTLLLAEIGHVPTEEQRPMLVTGVIVESLVALVLALGLGALPIPRRQPQPNRGESRRSAPVRHRHRTYRRRQSLRCRSHRAPERPGPAAEEYRGVRPAGGPGLRGRVAQSPHDHRTAHRLDSVTYHLTRCQLGGPTPGTRDTRVEDRRCYSEVVYTILEPVTPSPHPESSIT